MSKQLAISATFSVLAMAAFSLTATAMQPNPLAQNPLARTQTGAEAYATAPAAGPSVTGLLDIIR
ncbi:hypothetical protein [Aurantiacibacter gilvus]|uniref:Uncharacterized protein n=1 Tax=Aurantiacibacter gilvus TaxID=3139141 RepID=A0ABU9IFM9_9SPHN